MAPRLLFDENLARRLVTDLSLVFPGSAHVVSALRPAATDEEIWEYAKAMDMVIVTKDEDFQRFSVWRGFPPKVIWIQLGNCSTTQVASLLTAMQDGITRFLAHPDAAFLPLRQL